MRFFVQWTQRQEEAVRKMERDCSFYSRIYLINEMLFGQRQEQIDLMVDFARKVNENIKNIEEVI